MAVVASTRTGVATWLKVLKLACRLSHNAGFRLALARIIGEPLAGDLLIAWDVFCPIFEAVVAADDHPFEIDATVGEEEDRPPI